MSISKISDDLVISMVNTDWKSKEKAMHELHRFNLKYFKRYPASNNSLYDVLDNEEAIEYFETVDALKSMNV